MNLFCTKNSTHVNKHNQRHTIFDDRKAKKKKKKFEKERRKTDTKYRKAFA